MAGKSATAVKGQPAFAAGRAIGGMSLVERTVNALGREIATGARRPGESLPPEAEIARLQGVSRNVVREAMRMLATKGLLSIAQGSGTVVQPLSDWNFFDRRVIEWILQTPEMRDELVDELNTLRLIVEPEVCALATKVATMTEVLRLFEALELMETHVTDPVRTVEHDILFHRRLFEASHNRLLMSMLRAVEAVLRSNFAVAIRVDHAIADFLREHRAVAEAIHRRDPEEAREAMRTLLINNITNLTHMRQAARKDTAG
ncbi:MAG: FadR/GntR family transcriptional regulator [Pseudomonadota bacterium]